MITDTEISIRLVVAALLGSLVGSERERLLWAAGVRTHMLVSVGSALLMIVSAYGFSRATEMPHVVLDPSRVAAQVVSGIGFLGAGSILLRGQVVKGLTTAASVWSVAAIGLAAGGGLYFADALATGIILLILIGIKPLEEAYRSRVQSAVFSVLVERGSIEPDRVKKAPRRPRQPTPSYRHDPDRGRSRENKLYLTKVSQRDIRLSVSQLKDAPGIHSVEVEKRNAADTE